MTDITAVTMPKWGIEMSEGTLVQWQYSEGQAVQGGTELVEIETEKIVNSLEAPAGGILRRRLAESGDTLAVGALIGIIAAADTPEADIDAFISAFVPADASFEPEDGNSAAPAEPIAAAAPATDPAKISPIAKRVAGRLGVDLTGVVGTGRSGRISKQDVETAARQQGLLQAEQQEASDKGDQNPFRSERLTPTRKTIARRLTEAKQTIPHYYLTSDISAAALLAFKDGLEQGAQVTVNDLLIRAAALALKRVPELNSHLVDDEMRLFEHADIALAVATERGLLTPVVRAAENKSLAEIAVESRQLIEGARQGTLERRQITDGTFTLSNLGMHGIDAFQAVINPPQTAILALGAIVDAPVVDGGALIVGKRLSATLSCDHRAIDGALGARFLAEFKDLVESPAQLR